MASLCSEADLHSGSHRESIFVHRSTHSHAAPQLLYLPLTGTSHLYRSSGAMPYRRIRISGFRTIRAVIAKRAATV